MTERSEVRKHGRAYLVVAHRTLVEDHLLDHVRSLCADGDCTFHLVVPVQHQLGAMVQQMDDDPRLKTLWDERF